MTLLLNFLKPTASSALQNDPAVLTTLVPSGWESTGTPQDLHIILNYFYQEKFRINGAVMHPGQGLRTSMTVPPLTPRLLTASLQTELGQCPGVVAY